MAHYITDAEGNLIKVAGNFGGIKTKTLWTNPYPTSEFAPRTITLTDENLNTYSTIQIVYYNASYGNRYMTTEIKPDGNTYEMSGVHSSGSNVFVFYRGVKAGSNYIEFGDCWRGSNSGEAKTNTANIPVLVIGIKKSPDATYIGTELFEGNGVKITNGEISTYETIYDMKSSDSNVNLGFTSGVKQTPLVTTKFNDYHYLDVVVTVYPNGSTNTGGWSRVFRMDLTSNPVGSDWLIASYCCAYSDASAAGYVNKVTWNLVLLYNPSGNGIHCRCSFNGVSYTNSDQVYISKIYGVR